MPGGDGTGPLGMGSRTGRGMGYCVGYDTPGYASPVFRRRWFGFGRGFGRGWFGQGRRYRVFPGQRAWGYPRYYSPAPVSLEQEKGILQDEKSILEQEAKALKQELGDIEKRIQGIKKGSANK